MVTGFEYNAKNKANGLDLLNALEDKTVKVVFFDPQYRGVLDYLNYGDEKTGKGKDRSALPQMDEQIIREFLCEIDRVLKPSGYLFLWVDKWHVTESMGLWFDGTDLAIVDLITWDKCRIGMGYRTRKTAEYLVIVQKLPKSAKGWCDHSISDVWREKVDKIHPHSKPIELQKRLILATTEKDDLIVDPASGGFSVLEACRQADRTFLGCDIECRKNIGYQTRLEECFR